MKARTWGPSVASAAVMLILGCSSEEGSSSGGCGSSAAETCDINVEATICGDWITMECFGGATPESEGQCQKALEQEDEAVYCCASAAQPAEAPAPEPEPAAGGGGASGAGGAGGGV